MMQAVPASSSSAPSLPPREIFLLWQAGRTHSPLAARAIEITVETAREISQR
ncbi:hypothetical protein [Nonomuraea sp. SYSU D8015]|uniref:hypothetical protein n=1 Tax=Nonomuraea sp. SYSU D8015 TaxID=2593644 RepID=UPI001CB6FB2C|nr:hypothetical protein [Nonomuraea sp. SYSU D8015]